MGYRFLLIPECDWLGEIRKSEAVDLGIISFIKRSCVMQLRRHVTKVTTPILGQGVLNEGGALCMLDIYYEETTLIKVLPR